MEYKIYRRTVNYYETDKMQVVHHSNYIRFLEECRMDFLKQIGFDYDLLEEAGIMIPVLSVSCNYRTPARFGEVISIVPKLERFHGVKFDMSYKIYNEDMSVLHNDATSSHCFVDFGFKPVRIDKLMPELCEMFKKLIKIDLI